MKEITLDRIDLSSAVAEYKKMGALTYDTIRSFLGNAPVIVDSPDTDAIMESYEERAKYGRMAMQIEDKVRNLIAKEEGG